MSDRKGFPPAQYEDALRSRAIAAICIQDLSGCSSETAGASITDGHGDGGIDAFYFDQGNDQLIFVTSEYNKSGNQGIKASKVADFLSGVQRIVSNEYGDLNDKILNRKGEIRNALGSTRDVRLVIAIATTSTQPLSEAARQHVDRFVSTNYSGVPELCRQDYFDQKRLYRALVPKIEDVNIQVRLSNWGEIKGPYQAYYGNVPVVEVAQWWSDHGPSLYAKNIRALQADSAVNEAIERTVRDEPKHFWYFNNGITIVCRSIKRTMQIGEVIPLNCTGLSIVNGAQTVGTIGKALPSLLGDGSRADGHVHVRLIELGDDSEELHRRITEANNLQNAVTKRDFAGMDPVQHRIASDFALAGKRYVYKSGEIVPKGDEGCDLTDAAQALACADENVALAVQVKREIGQLWDSEKALYRQIFSKDIDSDRVWRAVVVMRSVDEALLVLRTDPSRNAGLACIHLNRVILHLVFRELLHAEIDFQRCEQDALIEHAKSLTHQVFKSVMAVLNERYAHEYLGTFSKNLSKCQELVQLTRPPVAATNPSGMLPFFEP